MKDKLIKILNKSVSKNRLAPDVGAEDCGCGSFNDLPAIPFITDCFGQLDATLTMKTEKFCTKEPEQDPWSPGEPFSECQGRCKKTYTCVKNIEGGPSGPGAYSSKVVYGQCKDPRNRPETPEL